MPRKVEVVLPPALLKDFLGRVSRIEDVTNVSVSRGGSWSPSGHDVVSISGSNHIVSDLYDILGEDEYASATSSTSELRSLLAREHREKLAQEGSELSWEEMGFFLRKETNPTVNFYSLMALCGAIAAFGLWQDALQVVIGAMVIAPGFEPLLRMPYGLAGPCEHGWRGAVATFGGYGTLALSAVLMTFLLFLVDPQASPDLRGRAWIAYWSTIQVTSVLVAVAGGIAGAVTLSADRPVLTAGVMIALALVPSMALTGMALAAADWSLAADGLLRWLVDAIAVMVAGGGFLLLKKWIAHRREGRA